MINFPRIKPRYLDTDNDGVADNDDIDINGNNILDHPTVNPYVEEQFQRDR